mmetsp:Transcript_4649/g.19799  ORF Transcript_4649/g.19799 Transcript_4649/m.19799 type:complete len:209 (+) Transcript_4649:915-1541(+)
MVCAHEPSYASVAAAAAAVKCAGASTWRAKRSEGPSSVVATSRKCATAQTTALASSSSTFSSIAASRLGSPSSSTPPRLRTADGDAPPAATHESGSAETTSACTAARVAQAAELTPRRAVAPATASAEACRGVQLPPMPVASPDASKSLATTAPKRRMTQAVATLTVATSPERHAARRSVAAPARVPSSGRAVWFGAAACGVSVSSSE